MKRVITSLICVYLCLLAAFSCGLGELLFADKNERPSFTENRMLKAFPTLNAGTILDGSFMDGFEAWLSDAFFFREGAADYSNGVMGLFRLRSEEDEADSCLQGQLWETDPEAQQEADLDGPEEEGEREEASPASGEGPADEAPERSEALAADDGRRPTPEVSESASFWAVAQDGTQRPLEEFPPETIAGLARVLNEYRAALPADGTVSMLTPMTSCIANTVLVYHKDRDWDSDLAETVQPYLDPGVRYFDITDILRPYIGQYTLYPTKDHHWHPISCKLAVNEILGEQGIVPNQYDEYLYRLSRLRDEGPFTTQELDSVIASIEQVPILVLNAPAEGYIVTDLNKRQPGYVIDTRFDEYAQYLGGPRLPWREFVTGYHTGRNALVIGDSYTQVFIPYLFPYYDEVLSTDFREEYANYKVGANVRQYIDYYGISDVYIVYSVYYSPNSDMIQNRLEQFFFKDYGG